MNREFIDAGIKLHVTVESKDALRKLEKLMVSLWHTTREQTREDEELNVHSIESEIYRRIRESENEKEEICMASSYTGNRCRLTKVEWDILDAYVQESYPGTFKQFSNLMCMKEKGYFKNVDPGKELKEILANCVVVECKE